MNTSASKLRTRAILLGLVAASVGCVSRSNVTTVATPSDLGDHRAAPPTTQPILYHRTGGFAGTDDRVVIWPDGLVEVSGKIMPPGVTRITDEQLSKLVAMFDGWRRLRDSYLDPNVADAYTITIYFGDKAVTASDVAPALPQKFRDIFTEIESIAGQTSQASTTNPQPEPTPP